MTRREMERKSVGAEDRNENRERVRTAPAIVEISIEVRQQYRRSMNGQRESALKP